ncbi:MAG TPA: NAD(P)/FAD-dependent oxidoreductase [Abditibacterium sp.]
MAIIGGGLAGCSAAISLARAGQNVAVFESGSLPRHRVCGEFLSPESRAVLRRLGVENQLLKAGAREVGNARFLSGDSDADFELGDRAGLAISRYALDPILWKAAQDAGAQTFLETKVRGLQGDTEGYEFEANSETWRANAVILAAGRRVAPKPLASESKARFCGLKAHFAGVDLGIGTVEMHLFERGYCGLVRIEGDATNVCMMLDYRALPKGAPDRFWEHLLSRNPALESRFRNAWRQTNWEATANVSFERFRPVSESTAEPDSTIPRGVLCAGDAAGYIHPLTGDGMAMALRAGELGAACARLGGAGMDNAEAARLYSAAWQREFAPRLQLAARLHPFALRPAWARPILPILRHLPSLRNAMVRGTRGAS